MTLSDECALSYYRPIAVLDGGHDVALVQHTVTGRVFVKKRLRSYNINVYNYLKEHPVRNIPHIYEAVEDGGVLTVIEEYISGSTLQEAVDSGESFSEEAAAHIAAALCEILHTLHCANPPIVHRDIKPSNVIITPDGTVKLIDLNAAKQSFTRAGSDTELMGTIGFAAPEQYGFGVSGTQTDIYSIGVLINYLMCGELPRTCLCGGALRPIVVRCTQMEPRDRFASVDELAQALGTVCGAGATNEDPGLIRRYALPGFRGRNVAVRIFSAFGYALLVLISLTLKVESGTLWLNRLVFFMMFFSIILASGNYLGVLEDAGIKKIKIVPLRVAAIIGLDVLIMAVWFTILSIGEVLIANGV